MTHDCVEIYRGNGKLLHTFSREEGGDWELSTPESAKARRMSGERHHLRTAGVYVDVGKDMSSGYDLGDGIPVIGERKLHRLLDGLAAAGISSIDSDGLRNLITARR